MKCNMDCLNCVYEDCINDEISGTETDELDNLLDVEISKRAAKINGKSARYRYNHSEKARLCRERYKETEKYKNKSIEYSKEYNSSEAGKERFRRYEQTEKAKERTRRYMNSTKYDAIREKKRIYGIEYRAKNKEHMREYMREYRARRKAEREVSA